MSHNQQTLLKVNDALMRIYYLYDHLNTRGERYSMVCSWYDGSSDRSLMVDPLRYFSLQPLHHDWCMWYVLSCLWNGAYKRTIAANEIE